MSCSNYPQTSPSDTDGSLLVYANKSGTAALVLSTSAKVLPPAGAAFAQGLALGLAANFREPASTVAGVTAAINSQPNNGIVGGLTFNREALAITGSAVQVLGLVAAISGIALGPLGWAAIIAAGGLNALADPAIQSLLKEHLGIDIPSLFGDPCDKGTKDPFNNAKRWQPPRDPIILDLDGDGLETVGLASNIYFDHNGDGVLTKTGWVGQGDALLVWDRNGNGAIDTGAELFGDFTPLPNDTLAPNGFAALAALDSNGDDTYLFGRGDGQDTVIDGDSTAGNSDTLRFKEWVAPTDVKLIRSGEDLVLACKGRRWRDGEAANKAWRIAA